MKKICSIILAASLAAFCLAGCSKEAAAPTTAAAQETTAVTEASAGETKTEETKAETSAESKAAEESSAKSTEAADATTASAAETNAETKAEPSEGAVRVGSLKGPTSMGLVGMMDNTAYKFTMVTAADELVAKIASGDLDIALVPANVASVLYNKTSNVKVIDINTLGVLYLVSSNTSLESIADLKGQTVYLTGKGTSPDYVLQYLLTASGVSLDDVTLEYKSEATEVAAVLKEQPEAIGLLPQPFVTVACTQNEALKPVMDMTLEWAKLQGEGGSRLVTGVTVVRADFLESNPDAVAQFLEDHFASADYANTNTAEAAQKVAELGIVAKAPIAQKAMPYCNIVCITGDDMKSSLSGYLSVLFEQEPKSVGGALPGDDFYYLP